MYVYYLHIIEYKEDFINKEEHHRPMKVLFVCVGNSCRSQMAEGFARYYGPHDLEVESAGTKPADKISSKAVEVMKELGIDISAQQPQLLTPELADSADTLISMGCGVEESCPSNLYDKFEDWGLEDPTGKPIEQVREIRDEIRSRVEGLIHELQC